MKKSAGEWLRQARYDIETAEYLFKGERYFYTVFLCHLSVEKALKGVYQRVMRRMAPKTHNFTYLIKKSGLEVPRYLLHFLVKLNGASIVTRYPESLTRLQHLYTKPAVWDILKRTKEAVQWIESVSSKL